MNLNRRRSLVAVIACLVLSCGPSKMSPGTDGSAGVSGVAGAGGGGGGAGGAGGGVGAGGTPAAPHDWRVHRRHGRRAERRTFGCDGAGTVSDVQGHLRDDHHDEVWGKRHHGAGLPCHQRAARPAGVIRRGHGVRQPGQSTHGVSSSPTAHGNAGSVIPFDPDGSAIMLVDGDGLCGARHGSLYLNARGFTTADRGAIEDSIRQGAPSARPTAWKDFSQDCAPRNEIYEGVGCALNLDDPAEEKPISGDSDSGSGDPHNKFQAHGHPPCGHVLQVTVIPLCTDPRTVQTPPQTAGSRRRSVKCHNCWARTSRAPRRPRRCSRADPPGT